MSKSLRLSEQWFNRGLWVIALVFAGFLIGLGNVIVGDLPQVDGQISRDDSSITPRSIRCAPPAMRQTPGPRPPTRRLNRPNCSCRPPRKPI